MTAEAESEREMNNGSRGERFSETFGDGTLLTLKMYQGITDRGEKAASRISKRQRNRDPLEYHPDSLMQKKSAL